MTTGQPTAPPADPEAAYRAWRKRWEPLRRLVIWFLQLRATGLEHVPPAGPAIVAPNHASLIDPALLVVVSPRRFTTLGKASLFRVPLLGAFLRAWGGHPIERETADVAAARETLRALRAGRVLTLFPERTRTRTGQLGPFTTGAAALALATGVPLVPVGIAGSYEVWPPGARLPRRRPVGIAIGPALDLSPWTERRRAPEAATEVTALLRQRVSELIETARCLHALPGPWPLPE